MFEQYQTDPLNALTVDLFPDLFPSPLDVEDGDLFPHDLKSSGENQLAEQAQKTVIRENSFRWTEADIAAAQPAWWFELARWICPSGYLGVIHRIWTHVGYRQPGAEGPGGEGPDTWYPLNNPFNPYWHEHFIAGNPGFGFLLRWRLQLDTMRKNEPVNAMHFRSQYELPGQPYPDLSTWNDQRFCWGNHARPIRLIVPEANTVRLFVGLETATGVDPNCWSNSDCVAP